MGEESTIECIRARSNRGRRRSDRAVVVLARRSVYDLPTAVIAIVSLAVLLFRWKVPEPVIIALVGVAGLALHG